MTDRRPANGWMLRPYFLNRHDCPSSSLDIDDELWLALRQPMEIPEVGLELMEKTNPQFSTLEEPLQRSAWREFRAYMRQAEGFWIGANALPWKSSPLNWYYSFLNLAKAVCLVKGTLSPRETAIPRVMHHGMTHHVFPEQPRWEVHTRNGVFPLLYRSIFGCSLPNNFVFDVREGLGYVRSLGWQLGQLGHSIELRYFPSYWVVLSRESEFWDIIGIPKLAPVDTQWPEAHAHFEELDFASVKDFAFQAFGMHARVAQSFRFFQRRKPEACIIPGKYQPDVLQSYLDKAFSGSAGEFVYGTDYQFVLNTPYSMGASTVPMNEAVAIYAGMFFLSSLVRYHPDYLDQISESAESWLIESFTRSAPLALLRYMANYVLGYTLVMQRA